MFTLTKEQLLQMYRKQGKSVQEIAHHYNCSTNKIRYWMSKNNIKFRTISEAIYLKNNPNGDPFKIKFPQTLEESVLYGVGLGLYWGEGTKADKNAVRLGNTDYRLIKKFILFLRKIFGIKKNDLKFGLQIFTDIEEKEALKFWINKLRVKENQFYKRTISKSIRKGTYGKKSEYGVLTLYYHNKKMRDALMGMLEKEKLNMPM